VVAVMKIVVAVEVLADTEQILEHPADKHQLNQRCLSF
jgi:hypothetical protein